MPEVQTYGRLENAVPTAEDVTAPIGKESEGAGEMEDPPAVAGTQGRLRAG
jgi:hypothetical protein